MARPGLEERAAFSLPWRSGDDDGGSGSICRRHDHDKHQHNNVELHHVHDINDDQYHQYKQHQLDQLKQHQRVREHYRYRFL